MTSQDRTIKKIFTARSVIEGAGVRLKRGFGSPEQVPEFDPFLLLDNFGSDDPKDYVEGFPWHPHRGIETVTYILEGPVEHQDSIGNKGTIGAGDVQWMTAGSGIIHQEMPQEFDGETKGFQLWVNLPKEHKMMDPRYREIKNKDIPVFEEDGVKVKAIAGAYMNAYGPVEDLIVDTIFLDVALEPNTSFQYIVPVYYTAFLYVFEGSVKVANSDFVEEGIVVLTEGGNSISVTAGEKGTRFLLIAGEPIGEPVAWAGPIVMNSDEEIQQAFREIHDGTFVKKKV
jgi:redox-sensitive bicupin YhaK (pirin superfamily)